MEIEEAAQEARALLNSLGFPYVNVAFYGLLNPLGFKLRNTIALSTYFCETHDWDDVSDLIQHEITHLLTEDDHEHGADFQHMADVLGVKDEYSQSENWDMFQKFVRDHPKFPDVQKKYLLAIAKVIQRRADAGIQGDIDLTSFVHPPKIEKRFDCDEEKEAE